MGIANVRLIAPFRGAFGGIIGLLSPSFIFG